MTAAERVANDYGAEGFGNVHFFLEDIFPNSVGKPLFAARRQENMPSTESLLVLAAMLVVVAHFHLLHYPLMFRSVLHKSLILVGR